MYSIKRIPQLLETPICTFENPTAMQKPMQTKSTHPIKPYKPYEEHPGIPEVPANSGVSLVEWLPHRLLHRLELRNSPVVNIYTHIYIYTHTYICSYTHICRYVCTYICICKFV